MPQPESNRHENIRDPYYDQRRTSCTFPAYEFAKERK